MLQSKRRVRRPGLLLVAARSRTASAFEFRPLGEDDAFDDAFEFFILAPLFEDVLRFHFEQAVIFIQPLAFDFLFELQNPAAAFASPVSIRQYARRLVRAVVG